jgi:hypothetical protein
MSEVNLDGWSLNVELLQDRHCSQYFADDQVKLKVLVEACITNSLRGTCFTQVNLHTDFGGKT